MYKVIGSDIKKRLLKSSRDGGISKQSIDLYEYVSHFHGGVEFDFVAIGGQVCVCPHKSAAQGFWINYDTYAVLGFTVEDVQASIERAFTDGRQELQEIATLIKNLHPKFDEEHQGFTVKDRVGILLRQLQDSIKVNENSK